MAADDLRARYVSLLMERFSETKYPSSPMMDRLEAAIRDEDSARRYVEVLLDHLSEDKYPSPPMLARVNRLLESF